MAPRGPGHYKDNAKSLQASGPPAGTSGLVAAGVAGRLVAGRWGEGAPPTEITGLWMFVITGGPGKGCKSSKMVVCNL